MLSALGHKMEHHKGKQATCKEDGEKEYWYCTRCKKYFLDEKGTKETTKEGLVISATGHKMEHHDRKEATNEQAGNIEYWYCTLCNNYLFLFRTLFLIAYFFSFHSDFIHCTRLLI